jgi:hypothetical protein
MMCCHRLLLFAVAWCVGMLAVLLASGSTVGAALRQTLPFAVALGVIVYVLRRRNEDVERAFVSGICERRSQCRGLVQNVETEYNVSDHC